MPDQGTTQTTQTTQTGPLRAGDRVPDFALKAGSRDGPQDFTLAQHLGKGPVVLAFFPLAFSAPCTKEICDMRDSLAQFAGLGATVLGFSTDTHFVNGEFAKAHDVPFAIVSDPNREVVGRIWGTGTAGGVHNTAKRGVMVIGADGTVKWTSISDDPKVWVGADEVRKHL